MQKITNTNYRAFLDRGEITTIDEEQITQALKNIKGRHARQGRSLLIALYLTGARPNEILQLRGKNISKQKGYFTIFVPASKGGLSRTIYVPANSPLTKELYEYCSSLFPEMLLFYNYSNNYTRTVLTQKGIKTRKETTDKLRYYVKKWFTGIIDNSISPYYLRHNRFSKLAMSGVNTEQIRILKGAKDIASVTPYVHLSSTEAKKIAKHIK